jgi:hypothetical protein
MNKARLLAGALGIVAAYAVTGVGQAHAGFGLTAIDSPLGPQPQTVYAGMDHGVARVFFRPSSGPCRWRDMGVGHLDGNYVINTSWDNDFLIVVGGLGTRFDVCGTSLFPMVYNGNFLDVNGVGGNDFVFNGTGDSFAWGSEGNDTLETFSPIGRALGENGSDHVYGTSAITTDSLEGGDGADCLQDFGNSSNTFDCGPDDHDFFVWPSTPTPISCEIPVSSC